MNGRAGLNGKWLLRVAVLLAAATVLLWSQAGARAAQSVQLLWNGLPTTPDVPPIIHEGRVMVPLRFVAERLGAQVEWDEGTTTVAIRTQEPQEPEPDAPRAPAATPVAGDAGVQPIALPAGAGLADVVAAVGPSVVTVVSLQEPFYGGGTVVAGWGSGVVIENGLILTNAHVVQGGYRFVVVTADQRKLAVERVWADALSDVAVIKAAGTALPAAKLGTADGLRVGDAVFAIGTPYSLHLQSTVTTGIISGRGRISQLGYYPFLQTDAAINNGNSGGALVNLQGQVIGIPTLKVIEEGFQGLGFAIPIDVAVRIKDQLLKNGRVIRPFLGVQIQEGADAAIGLPSDEGLKVTWLTEGGPAKRSGIAVDDVIVRLNDRKVSSLADIYEVLFSLDVGTTIPVDILRNGQPLRLQLQLQERPAD